MKEKALKKLNELLEREEKREKIATKEVVIIGISMLPEYEKQQGVVNGIKLAIEEIELLKEDK